MSASLAGVAVNLPRLGLFEALRQSLLDLGARIYEFHVEQSSAGARTIEQWLDDLVTGRFQDVIFTTGQGVRIVVDYAQRVGQWQALREALGRARVLACSSRAGSVLNEVGIRVDAAVTSATAHLAWEGSPKVALCGREIGMQSVGLASSLEVQLSSMLEARGAVVRRVAPIMTCDRSADEVVDRLRLERGAALILTSAVQVRWLLAAVVGTNRETEIRRAVSSSQVLATGTAAQVLYEHGLPARRISLDRLCCASPGELLALLHGKSQATVLGQVVAGLNDRAPTADLQRQRVVVVGAGMVGQRFCELLSNFDRQRRYRIVLLGEEAEGPYNRTRLGEYSREEDFSKLCLAEDDWHAEQDVSLLRGQRVVSIEPEARMLKTSAGLAVTYDQLVLACGAVPRLPSIEGLDKRGVFVYRNLEDLQDIKRHGAAAGATAVVVGGGLLGLEAAGMLQDLGMTVHLVESNPVLMPSQLDHAGGELLRRLVAARGIQVHTSDQVTRVEGEDEVRGVRLANGAVVAATLVIVSAGAAPRDDLARALGLALHASGGILVDGALGTSDPCISAIGDCAAPGGKSWAGVQVGYRMAEVLARRLTGESAAFVAPVRWVRLNLPGVEAACFGEPFGPGQSIVYEDLVKGVYKKLLLSEDHQKLLGGVLVGEADELGELVALAQNGSVLPKNPETLILVPGTSGTSSVAGFPSAPEAHVCSCRGITLGRLRQVIRDYSLTTPEEVISRSKAGSVCGMCTSRVRALARMELGAERESAPQQRLESPSCAHFSFNQRELYELIQIKGCTRFEEVLSAAGQGQGCSVCRSVVEEILQRSLQQQEPQEEEGNQRALANIQRSGLYSVVPRVPGGEITADKLITLGRVAKHFGLYTKITSGQRIDLLGAEAHQLPQIWAELVAAGFESGHAYGRALRTVRSCVGDSWCRYGLGDAVGLAIRVEQRYKGLRAPHKIKGGVSGCLRECAEASSKDFGLIAGTEGWDLYVGGNGGAAARRAELLSSGLDEATVLRYLDRYLMYYVRTAPRRTRTAVWLQELPGGIEHVRDVVVRDSLGVAAELEAQMQALVDAYRCEWKAIVDSPEKRRRYEQGQGPSGGCAPSAEASRALSPQTPHPGFEHGSRSESAGEF